MPATQAEIDARLAKALGEEHEAYAPPVDQGMAPHDPATEARVDQAALEAVGVVRARARAPVVQGPAELAKQIGFQRPAPRAQRGSRG